MRCLKQTQLANRRPIFYLNPMKTLFPFTAVLLLLAAGAFADTVLTEKLTSGSDSSIVTYKFKDDKIRSEISPDISMITEIQSGDAIVLRHADKTYQKFSAAKTKETLEKLKLFEAKIAARDPGNSDTSTTEPPAEDSTETSSPASSGTSAPAVTGTAAPVPSPTPEPDPVLLPTGRKEAINGYETEEYLLKSSKVYQRYWLTKSFPNGQNVQTLMAKAQQKTFSQLSEGYAPPIESMPGMPIKIETEVKGQKVSFTVISAVEAHLPEKEFEIPGNYTELVLLPEKKDKNSRK